MTLHTDLESAFSKTILAHSTLRESVDQEVDHHVKSALIAMIEDMEPSRDILRKMIWLQDPDLLAAVMKTHGSAPYIRIQESFENRVSLTPLYAGSCVDMLRVMLRAGLPVAEEENTLRATLRISKQSDLLSFFLIEAGRPDLLFRFDAPDALKTLSGTSGSIMAQAYMSLDRSMQQEAVQQVVSSLTNLVRVKHLAFALLSGFDIAWMFEKHINLKFLQPAVRGLVEQTRSSHARLSLHAREGSLQDVLSRPKDATFFGLTDKDLRA
jgi:hypothetical protein